MTRFIYITDTHLGASREDFLQQPSYPDKLPELLSILDSWITKEGDIQFVLHGGDIIHSTTLNNIREASRLFRFTVPVYLCLGNHDMTEKGALEMWLDAGSNFFPHGSANFTIYGDDCLIHVSPTQWNEIPYYCQDKLSPHFLNEQLNEIEAIVERNPNVPGILCTHSQIQGVPPEQTGFERYLDKPELAFVKTISDFLRKSQNIQCVLSGHIHINTIVKKDNVHYVTTSSLIETPFEYKVIEIEKHRLKIVTMNLISNVGFVPKYDFNKNFVQGRIKDRVLEKFF